MADQGNEEVSTTDSSTSDEDDDNDNHYSSDDEIGKIAPKSSEYERTNPQFKNNRYEKKMQSSKMNISAKESKTDETDGTGNVYSSDDELGKVSPKNRNHEKKQKNKTENIYDKKEQRSRTTIAEKRDAREQKCSFMQYLLVILFIVLLAAGTGYYFEVPNQFSTNHSYNSEEVFLKNIQQIFDKYPNQFIETKKLIQNVGKEHLQRVFKGNMDDLRPLSFLIAGYAGSETTVECFVEDLGKAFTHQTFDKLNSPHYQDKEELDKQIKSSLRDKQKFVVIENIEKLPFKTAQLFMVYSDSHNDLATYPQSLLVLTTILPFEFSAETSSRKQDEKQVADHFIDTVWKGQGPVDSIAPLWTRVGDGLVLLKKSEVNCEKNNHHAEL